MRTGQNRELGLKARRFVERNSWDRVTAEFEQVLNEAVRSRKTGSLHS